MKLKNLEIKVTQIELSSAFNIKKNRGDFMVAIRFVAAIIWIGIFLGMIECLMEATKYIDKQAAEAHQVGLISYGRFSRL
jgi:hypothetical protein